MPSRPRPLRVLLSHVKGTPPETLLVVEVIPLSILALTDGAPHWRSRMERLAAASSTYDSMTCPMNCLWQIRRGAMTTLANPRAEPLLAIVLLGVLGVCWRQVDTWSGAPNDTDPAEVASHIRRVEQIARWVNAALVLTFLGSVALFAGLLLPNSHPGDLPSLIWSRDIYEAASVLAVAAIVSGGIWAATRLRPRSDGRTPPMADRLLGDAVVGRQSDCPRMCARTSGGRRPRSASRQTLRSQVDPEGAATDRREAVGEPGPPAWPHGVPVELGHRVRPIG